MFAFSVKQMNSLYDQQVVCKIRGETGCDRTIWEILCGGQLFPGAFNFKLFTQITKLSPIYYGFIFIQKQM